MRDFKSMKRQRGRNRGGGNTGGGGGGKPQQNANRAFESNGPDNLKIRGHAQHVYEKYQQLARDAMSAGDRVLGENFLQHAEHYFRLIRTLQPNRPYTDIVSREGFASGYDIDFEDEGGEGGNEEQESSSYGEGQSSDGGDYREQQPRQDRWENRDNRNGGDGQGQNRPDQNRQDYNRPNGERGNQNRQENRQGGERQDYNRDQQPRQDGDRQGGYASGRSNNGNRNDRNFNRDQQPRQDRWENRDNRNGTEGRPERVEAQDGEVRSEERRPERTEQRDRPEREGYGRRDRAYGDRGDAPRDPLPVVEPQASPLTAPQIADAPSSPAAAEKPTRTRVLRSRDGDESHTPAFLQAGAAPAPAAADEAPVKRGRGRPKKTVETAPAETEEV
jgi:hypothetical protein